MLGASLVDMRQLDVEFFKSYTPEDWNDAYIFACEQGVLGLTFDAISALPSEARPPQDVFFSWMMHTQIAEKIYVRYCKAISNLNALFEEAGLKMILLKGLTVSLPLYSHPERRKYCDIDILTDDFDKSREVLRKAGINFDSKHSKHDHLFYEGFLVENHRCLLTDRYMSIMTKSQEAVLLESFSHVQNYSLPDGTTVLGPGSNFYAQFIPYHIFEHARWTSVTVRQLCDWLLFVDKYGLSYREILPRSEERRVGKEC